jgi:hypothetical protein
LATHDQAFDDFSPVSTGGDDNLLAILADDVLRLPQLVD